MARTVAPALRVLRSYDKMRSGGGGDVAGASAVRRLRLRILQVTAAVAGAAMLARALTASPLDTALTQGARLVFVALAAFVLARADANTAHAYGMAVVVIAKIMTTARGGEVVVAAARQAAASTAATAAGGGAGAAAPAAAFSPLHTLVVYGSNRVTPRAAAVFGGVPASVAVAGWGMAEAAFFYNANVVAAAVDEDGPRAEVLAPSDWAQESQRELQSELQSEDGPGGPGSEPGRGPGRGPGPERGRGPQRGPVRGPPQTMAPSEMGLLMVEILYIATVTLIACTVERGYRTALVQLTEALDARQQFINNMVR